MENKLLQTTKNFPNFPGVYLMKDKEGKVLYVGKAGSLKKRVSSYFQKPQDSKTESLISHISKIDYQKTDSVIEAMLSESDLIKKFQPPYNIRQKDDKSYLYVTISKEDYPRVFYLRGRDIESLRHLDSLAALPKDQRSFRGAQASGKRLQLTFDSSTRFSDLKIFGPYTSASALRESLDIIRKIFPFRTCKLKIPHRLCLWYQMYKFPAPCNRELPKKEYQNIIKNLILFLKGKKSRVVKNLEKEMKELSKGQRFEQAAKIRNQIFSLQHIQDVAVIKGGEQPENSRFQRIECYDISNIGGKYATGSMVVFEDKISNKDEYRRFKIRTVKQIDDTGMLREILMRRFKHREWQTPNLIIVDGGKGQLTVVNRVLKKYGLNISTVAVAKGPERKKADLYFSNSHIKVDYSFKRLVVEIRDESHRFAIKYHRLLRKKEFLK